MVALGLLIVVAAVTAAVAASRHQPPGGLRAHPAGGRLAVPAGPASLRQAVERGIITDAQAAAIEALEAAPPMTGPRSAPGVTPVVEILGYLGALLALLGAGILVAQFWEDLESWSRLLLLAVVALALLAAGLAVGRDADQVDDAGLRLQGFLLLLSTAATAGFAGLLAADVFEWRPEAVVQVVGATVAVHAGVLWGRRATRPAQHLATFGGLFALVAATGARLDGPGLTGAVLLVLSAFWLVAGWRGLLPPAGMPEALGSLGMLVGCAVLAGSQIDLGLAAGLATSGGLLAAGVQGRRPVVTAAGVLGILGFLPSAVAEWFGESVGVPLAFLLTGGLLLGLTVRLVRRGREPERVSRN